MKMQEALKIINANLGFRVHFEWVRRSTKLNNYFDFIVDHFPDDDEPPIKTEEEAWELAYRFASQMTGKAVNIHVVDSECRPVPGYDAKLMNRYPLPN